MRSRGVDGAIIIIATVTKKYSLRDLLLTEARERRVEVGRRRVDVQESWTAATRLRLGVPVAV